MTSKSKIKEFDPIFNPKSIAIVGASKEKAKVGNIFLGNFLESGYKGELYPINPTVEELMGVKCYPSLRDIPDDTVDYAISIIPKKFILDLLDDGAAKGLKVLQMFTAGMLESGEKEGQLLEEEIASKARNLGIRIIGPNCAGISSPGNPSSLALRPAIQQEKGEVAFVSQSGGHAGAVMEIGIIRGIRLGKSITFGNGSDMTSVDFLEYLAVDPEIKYIGLYLEGLRGGPRVLELIKEISRTKPIVFWKGGRTEAGAGAALSHTGSMAGAKAVWAASVKQAGAIEVDSMEELADTLLTFQCFDRFEGNRAAAIAGLAAAGGGASVAMGDACMSQGLQVIPLSKKTGDALKEFVPTEGRILVNPMDVWGVGAEPEGLTRILDIVFSDPNVDVAIIHIATRIFLGYHSEETFDAVMDALIDFRNKKGKHIVAVLNPSIHEALQSELAKKLAAANIPSHPTFERAAKAIVNVSNYWRTRASAKG